MTEQEVLLALAEKVHAFVRDNMELIQQIDPEKWISIDVHDGTNCIMFAIDKDGNTFGKLGSEVASLVVTMSESK